MPADRTTSRVLRYIGCMGLAMAASAGLAGAILARSGIDAFGLSACVAGIIWAIDSAALAIIAVTPSGLRRVNSVLFAMLIRLAGPLSAVVYLSSTGQEAARPGLMGLVLVHYLVGLACGTWAIVRLISSDPGVDSAAQLA